MASIITCALTLLAFAVVNASKCRMKCQKNSRVTWACSGNDVGCTEYFHPGSETLSKIRVRFLRGVIDISTFPALVRVDIGRLLGPQQICSRVMGHRRTISVNGVQCKATGNRSSLAAKPTEPADSTADNRLLQHATHVDASSQSTADIDQARLGSDSSPSTLTEVQDIDDRTSRDAIHITEDEEESAIISLSVCIPTSAIIAVLVFIWRRQRSASNMAPDEQEDIELSPAHLLHHAIRPATSSPAILEMIDDTPIARRTRSQSLTFKREEV